MSVYQENQNNDSIKRLSQTFGDGKDKYKYYVYMLIVEGEGKPFYIGKGAGARVFAHEFDAEEMLKAINEGRDDIEANYNKLSEKIKTIINNKGKIKKVIVKWGLTSEEAFMCESALINMYDYLCKNPSQTVLSENDILSNIVNGHASKKEKEAKNLDSFDTKARTVDDFLKNVAIDTLDFKTLNIQEPIVFITINPSMEDWPNASAENPNLNFDDYVYECVRGYWKVNKRRFQKAKYIIALNKQVVIGVYCIDSIIKFFDKKNKIPTYPQRFRKNDRNIYNNLKQYSSSQNLVPQGSVAQFNKYNALVGFTRKTPSPTDQTYAKLQSLIRTTELNDTIFKTRQAAVTYNYEIVKGNTLSYYNKW